MLVADFVGPSDDPNLAVAARELIAASLAQSDVASPISHSELARGLALAMKPDTTRIAGEVARELAYRASARVYVEGRVDRVASGFSIVLNVLDAKHGNIVFAVTDAARGEDDLIPTLDRLGKNLREKIGESKESIESSEILPEAITPSFEAYRLWVDARRLSGGRAYDLPSAIRLLREALALDPEFAGAWLVLGVNYDNLGQDDSARKAYNEALARPTRLTEVQRLKLQALVAFLDCDYHEALRIYDLLDQRHDVVDPNRSNSLRTLGRYEDALKVIEEVGETAPFGASQTVVSNRVQILVQLGRADEAEQFLDEIRDWRKDMAMIQLSLIPADWARAESLAAVYKDEGSADNWLRYSAKFATASASAARGEIETALSVLQRGAEEADTRYFLERSRFARLHLALVSGNLKRLSPTEMCQDSSSSALITRGILSATLGDVAAARTCASATQQKPLRERRRYATDVALLEAWIAAGSGDWKKVIEMLRELTTQGQEPSFTGRHPIRWLLAEAYFKLSEMDQAAKQFELVLQPARLMDDELVLHGIPYSFAQHKLVLLYARIGRVEDARRHWEIFQKTFTNPDPELRPMIEEAREALAKAEARP